MAKNLSIEQLKEKLPIYMDIEQRRGYEEFYGIKLVCLPGWKAITIRRKEFQMKQRPLEDLSEEHCKERIEEKPEIDTFLFKQHDKDTMFATPLMILEK